MVHAPVLLAVFAVSSIIFLVGNALAAVRAAMICRSSIRGTGSPTIVDNTVAKVRKKYGTISIISGGVSAVALLIYLLIVKKSRKGIQVASLSTLLFVFVTFATYKAIVSAHSYRKISLGYMSNRVNNIDPVYSVAADYPHNLDLHGLGSLYAYCTNSYMRSSQWGVVISCLILSVITAVVVAVYVKRNPH